MMLTFLPVFVNGGNNMTIVILFGVVESVSFIWAVGEAVGELAHEWTSLLKYRFT